MIPMDHLQQWALIAPWPDSAQIEQDLIISRALCDLFNEPRLAGKIAFRGGTAIHKLLFPKPLRYSEDIDLVQVQAGPIGPIVDGIRAALDWLGPCKREPATHSMHMTFRFPPEGGAPTRRKLKVEINTREHQNLFGLHDYPFRVDNPWFTGQSNVTSFAAEELFGTKLRALLQRRKSRDLFDLSEGLLQLNLDLDKMIQCFDHYLNLEGTLISRAAAEQRLLERFERSLTEDIAALLPAGATFSDEDAIDAIGRVWFRLLTRLRGESWKLSGQMIEHLRETKAKSLLTDRAI